MRRLSCLAWLLATSVAVSPVQSQTFALKTGLAAGGIVGCSAVSVATRPPGATPSTDAEAQQLIADGEDAALQGEHATAKEAFTKAAALVPGNARLAYYLGRVHEALAENADAVRQYCRYLALSPTATDADDVRGRIVRLTPTNELARLEEARANFQSGVALARRKQLAAADSVFGAVASIIPNAPEPYFNRALSRAARGDRVLAMQDFERYLELAPQANDRGTVRQAMARLPEEVFNPRSAFGSGLAVPGLGQMTTGRPLLGVLVLGASGAGAFFALRTQSELVVQRFTDPFGNAYTDSVTQTSRKGFTVGVASVATVWLLSALEARSYAKRSRKRAESIIATERAEPPRQVSLDVRSLPRDRLGIGLSLR